MLGKRFALLNPSLPQASGVSALADIPRLHLRQWKGSVPRRGTIHYEEEEHKSLPHVVKFSGGRSSGLMLAVLLKNRLLNPDRGDVVLFTNTAAEHPATYDFIRKMKPLSELAGIPFFIAQLQTYETVVRGEWRRPLSYRLVNAEPFDKKKNPNGYNFRGEVFEETIAWAGMLPNVHTRICTTLMKMRVTREFLADWFAGKPGIAQQGQTSGVLQCDPRRLHDLHRRNKGTMIFSDFKKRWETLSKCSTFRPQQRFQDYTKAKITNSHNELLAEHVFGNKCSLFGEDRASFITLLGFREGEDARYQRMVQRNRGGQTPGHDTHPPGEYSYAPLFNLGIDQKSVKAFWDKQPARLRPRLPKGLNLSNCVFCFLKGKNNILGIQKTKKEFEKTLPKALQKECRRKNTPNSISWWINMEKKYARKSRKGATNQFGMLGLNSVNYETLTQTAGNKTGKGVLRIMPSDAEDPSISCECTD